MTQTIEQVLKTQGRGFFATVGDSMEPLLHNRQSTVVIETAVHPLSPGTVALYRRPSGEYVLHRIIRVERDAYRIRGDNRLQQERVPQEWVLGVMVGYYPDEREHYVSCTDAQYRQDLRRVRRHHWALWLRALPGRIRHKLAQLQPPR